jgi:McrBC 5-methylcytosine restriction system component
MRPITLRASPMQKLSGIALRNDGTLRVAIAVLPKLWRASEPTGEPSAWAISWSNDTLSATMYEGDTLTVHISGEHADRKADLINSLTVECGANTDADKTLFALAPVPADSASHAEPRTDFNSAALDLMQLADLAEIDPLNELAGDFGANSVDLNWLLPFLHRRFVHGVSDAMRHARRGYVERRETLNAFRGRPRGESLALALATGVAAVEFEFEEFEFATPLLRAIATGLEAVARATLSSSGVLQQVAAESKSLAIGLRNRIAEVPALPARDALRIARTARLHRLERAWDPVLRLIDPILQQSALVASEDSDTAHITNALSEQGGGKFLRIEIPTWKVWQNLLTTAARCIGAVETSKTDPPWSNLTNDSRPDIDLRWNERRFIIDAKYKHFGRNVNIADAYQMFAYSHLVQGEPKAYDLYLAYPNCVSATAIDGHRRMPQHRVNEAVRLNIVPLPWPTRSDLAAPGTYRAKLSTKLRERLTAMSR